MSLRLIKEIHAKLMTGARGSDKTPGEFRTSQNYIGVAGEPLARARFVPPPPEEMWESLDNFEKFLHDEAPLPDLIRLGLAHAQFETIHPFLDGNGRVGRLLITFLPCERGILRRPLLYLSHYFKRYKTEYNDRLQAIRDAGAWERWSWTSISKPDGNDTQCSAIKPIVFMAIKGAGQARMNALHGRKNSLTPMIPPVQG